MRGLEKELHECKQRNDELLEANRQLTERIRELEAALADAQAALDKRKTANDSKPPKFRQNYSLDQQEKEERKKDRKKEKKNSPGRRPNSQKADQTQRTENVYPEGVPPERCSFVRERFVWRLIDGRAVFVRYRLYKETWTNNIAQLPDVLPHSEYGTEIAITLAYLVYGLNLSIDHGRELLRFFCHLELSASQANELLNHLAKLWKSEFDTLVELMALATVVYMDETGWKVSSKNCYAWVFTSMLHTVLLYGRSRESSVLDEILPRDVFQGIGVSDNYSAYSNRFTKSQKCWAHLLRKAIKLMLTYPGVPHYRKFFEALLDVFREGKRLQKDEQLSPTQRERKVAQLEERFRALCSRFRADDERKQFPGGDDYSALLKELVRCLADNALFTFVLHPEVEPTNNTSEQKLRGSAQARKTGRTSKTPAGAQRRSVIASVFASLRQNLETLTLKSVLEEVIRWCRTGRSLFSEQLDRLRETCNPPPEAELSPVAVE